LQESGRKYFVKNRTVEEFMVPLGEYATVSEDSTLVEAVKALEEAQNRFDQRRYPHRAVLVLNHEGRLVGKLSQHDVIKALEPNYRGVKELDSLSRFGISPTLVESMVEQYGLWRSPFASLCKAAAETRVKEVMYAPQPGEYILESVPVTRALHHLVMGSHHSLLVTDEEREIVGVLRLTDIFALVCQTIEGCEKAEAKKKGCNQ
jgi:CBS domain-containing protein